MKTVRILILVTILAQAAAYAQLANTAWPMFRHDLKHSATSQYTDPPSSTALKCNISGGSILSSCAIGSSAVYLGAGNYLYSINLTTGGTNWTYNIGSTRSTPAVATDGTIYVGSNDDKLYAINSNGTFKWSYNTGGDVTGSPAIATDGKIYIGSRSGILYSLNANGTKNWQRTLSDMHMTSPAIGPDGVIYVGGGYLYAVNSNNSAKWSYSTGTSILTTPALNSDASRVYFGSGNQLYCLNTTNGALVWTFPVNYKAGSTPASPAVAADGTIYVGGNWGVLHSITPAGVENWHYDTGSDIRSSPAVTASGTVIFCTMDGYIYALNPDGTLKWRYLTKAGIFASPAIGSQGVWVGSWDGIVYGNVNHTPPAATPPSNLTATALTEATVRLSWADNSSDEYGFSIHRRTGTGAYELIDTVGPGVMTYSDITVSTGETYYYEVAAFQEGGYAYSNEVSVSVPGILAPSNCTATQVAGVGIQVGWADNTSLETGDKVERKDGDLGRFHEIATLGVDAVSFTDATVNPATDYWYRVRSFNGANTSAYSNEAWCASEGMDYSEITHGNTSRPQIALMFSSGTADVQWGILDTLRSNNVRCTFFVVGNSCIGTEDYWITAANDGNQILGHSWDHPDYRYITDEQIVWELNTVDDYLYGLLGTRTRPYFLAPYETRNAHILEVAAAAGWKHLYFSTNTGDVDYASVQTIIDRALAGAQNGAIILFHATMPNTTVALPTIISTLKSQGYDLVTVPELIAPVQVTSPPEAICSPRSLMSLPIEPAYSAPLSVFRGAAIDYHLTGWNYEGQGSTTYDAGDPVAFGGMTPDYGYWFQTPSPMTMKINGSTQTVPRHIYLPHAYPGSAGWTIIGYPFLTSQLWSNCSIYNPNAPAPQTRSITDAAAAGWINSVMIGYDSLRRGSFDVGIEDDAPYTLMVEPWHGYWLRSRADDLQLIVPPP